MADDLPGKDIHLTIRAPRAPGGRNKAKANGHGPVDLPELYLVRAATI